MHFLIHLKADRRRQKSRLLASFGDQTRADPVSMSGWSTVSRNNRIHSTIQYEKFFVGVGAMIFTDAPRKGKFEIMNRAGSATREGNPQIRKLNGFLEIALVFGVAAVIIGCGLAFVGEDLFARQLVVVAANIAMLFLIWLGLRLRRQRIDNLGLSLSFSGWKPVTIGFAKSLAVLVLALAGFMFGSIVMANITGIPDQADTSGYSFMKGNLPMLLVSLAVIYVVSSLGEEVVYRGFLINRFEELFGGGRKATWVAAILSSLIFGLAHFGWGIVGVVQTTFMGFALAGSYLLFRRNLWILVAAHAYMDTALIVPMYFS